MSKRDEMFGTLKRVRAYEQIADEVRERILKGAIQPGDKLPGERELAGQFGVNRSTVREAMKSLSELGLVVVRHGGGAVVQDYAARAGLQILPYLFPRDGTGSLELMASVLEARRIFTTELTRLAIERATPDEGAELERLAVQVEEAAEAEDLERFQTLDFDFVGALARASHNAIFGLIMNSIRPVYEQQHALFRPLYTDPAATAAIYRKVVGCLKDREADRAARLMEGVMRGAETHVEEVLGGLEPTGPARPGGGPARPKPRESRTTHRRK